MLWHACKKNKQNCFHFHFLPSEQEHGRSRSLYKNSAKLSESLAHLFDLLVLIYLSKGGVGALATFNTLLFASELDSTCPVVLEVSSNYCHGQATPAQNE